MRTILAILASLICTLATAAISAADPVKSFQGEWRTTIGIVKLQQKGSEVTGTYGMGDRFPLKGTVKDNVLTFEYTEGQAKGDGKFTLDESGNAFAGNFQVRNGRGGDWNGWRPDPKAPADKKAGSFAGLWLTDLGLMDLTQEGPTVTGQYAIRGTSKIEGKATGRRLDFRFTGFRNGQGWFDLSTDGKSLSGASNTDGFAQWFGWSGRPAPSFVRHAPLVAGKIVDGSTANLLTYAIRAPEGYKAGDSRKWPAILILHGSNMNAQSYVATIAAAWPDIARDFIILGFNGETPSNTGDDPRFNYTYVNYVGKSTYKGFPGTDRESPALVSEAMDDLKGVYPIDHYLVGGHSQGGFLTYSLLMNTPESMAGAFPISAGVIFQCEPDAYTDLPLRKAQRNVPLAIIHGKNDPIMGFGMGQYAATLFGEQGWQAFRFFTDDTAAHMFARLPVGPAIRWLEAQASKDPKTLIDFATERVAKNGYRDAIAALNRARTLKLDATQKRRADALGKTIDAKASSGAAKYLPLIRKAKDGSWIDGFLAYRDDFEFAQPAQKTMAAFGELRKTQDAPAKEAFGEARQLFQQGKQNEGYAKYKEIVQKDYASSLYRIVKRSLDERK
jgi:predicted esterase